MYQQRQIAKIEMRPATVGANQLLFGNVVLEIIVDDTRRRQRTTEQRVRIATRRRHRGRVRLLGQHDGVLQQTSLDEETRGIIMT
jgi:hypothetical protein